MNDLVTIVQWHLDAMLYDLQRAGAEKLSDEQVAQLREGILQFIQPPLLTKNLSKAAFNKEPA